MRYIDKLMAEYPEDIEVVDEGDIKWVHVSGGCPFDYGYCLNKDLPCDTHDQATDDDPYPLCHRCWHREIPKDTTTAYDWVKLAMDFATDIKDDFGVYKYLELRNGIDSVIACLKNALDKMKQEGDR